MSSYLVDNIGKLKLITVNNAERFTEVCIGTKLPKNIEELHETVNYDVSVRFHNEGEIDVLVYDNDDNETRSVKFTSNVNQQLIDFANRYINKSC